MNGYYDDMGEQARRLVTMLEAVTGDREAALICARYAQEIDLQATRFLNAGSPVLERIVLYEEQLLLQRTVHTVPPGPRAFPVGYRASAKLDEWVVGVSIDDEGFPDYLDHYAGDPLALYPPVDAGVEVFVDNSGTLHFHTAANALQWKRDVTAVIEEHGLGARVSVGVMVRSAKGLTRHERTYDIGTRTQDSSRTRATASENATRKKES